MGKQAASRHMHGVRSSRLAPFRNLYAFGERVAFLLPWYDVVVIDPTDLNLQVEFTAYFGADCLNHVQQKPSAVRQRAAILIRTIIDPRAQKLGEQIAVGSV